MKPLKDFVTTPLHIVILCVAIYLMWPMRGDKLLAVFEAGGVPGWESRLQTHDTSVPLQYMIDRPEVEAALQNVLWYSGDLPAFHAIVGEPGTGKSTAVIQAISKRNKQGGVAGAVYFEMPARPERFALDLAGALGLSSVTKEKPALDLKGEPMRTWAWLGGRITAAGKAFSRKHDRPMTLVLDGVDVLATPQHLEF